MNVSAINTISNLNFEGKSNKKEKKENNYQQFDSPASKKAARAMRNYLTGLGLLAAAASMQSCDDGWGAYAHAESSSSAYAYAIGCDCKNDTTVINDTIINTIIKPVYIKEYPFHLADSLINQGLNIGVELDGPKPIDGEGNRVAFVASKAHNEYDNKFYETHLDSARTTNEQLSLVTKVIDFYDEKNPKTSWMRTIVSDVPGKGILLRRYVSDSAQQPQNESQWNYAGKDEIRSNGARGNNKGTNRIYDKNGNMIWQGEYIKGQNPGTFMYGTVVYDPEGNPYTDEDGNPEIAHYDFDKAKMWSEEVMIEEIPNPDFGKL